MALRGRNYIYETDDIGHEKQKECCIQQQMKRKGKFLIYSIILRKPHEKRKVLHLVYIDYKKEFDSVPRTHLIRILRINNEHPDIFLTYNNGVLVNNTSSKHKTT